MNETLDTRETKRVVRNTESCTSNIEYNGNRYKMNTEGILKPTTEKAVETNLLDEMNRRFDKLEKDLKNDIKNATDEINTRLDSIDKEIKEIKSVAEQTNVRLDLLENKVDNVIKLNNLKV